jgi:YegS/Rv2252/BmrU family lipid kinase
MTEVNKEKWAFIVNPTAGNGSGRKMISLLESKIKEFDIDGEIFLTGYPGHATELSASALEKGMRNIIAVGGDGTMNEISRPLINKKEVTVGIIPAGTGNDFDQITGFPVRFRDEDWKIFFSKNVTGLDVGIVNESIFLNGMGLGFDAEVAAQNYTEDGKVKKGGADKYIWHIVKTLLFFKEKRMAVITDTDTHERDCFINTVSIGRRFAGSFFLTPKAIANDGLLDVCSIKKLNLFHRFRLLLKVPQGTHITDKRVLYYQTSTLLLEFPDKVPYHVDGEIFFASKFDVRVIPQGLKIIYNPDGDHYFGSH